MRFPLTQGRGRFRAIAGERIATLCLALFVFAGYVKAADLLRDLPVDLTLLFWAATGGLCLVALWQRRQLPPGTVPLLVVFAAFALGLHWPQDLGSYAVQKELRLFSLTALAAFAPLVLLQDDDGRFVFASSIGILGAVMACAAVIEVVASASLTRIGVFNTNPILLARASGFTVLLLCVLYWLGHLRLVLFLPAVGVSLFGLLVSASRGPLAALLATAVILAALSVLRRECRARVVGTLVCGIAALAAAVLLMDHAMIDAGHRIVRLFSGDWSGTEMSRWSAWRQTLQLIAESPLGVGWGRFSEHVRVYHDGILLTYPHNILLEIAVEAGWLAAAAFTVLIGAVLVRAARAAYGEAGFRAADPTRSLVVFGAMTYWLGCALFSGDVNDNRPLWVMMGMALAAEGPWRAGGRAGG